MPGDIIIVQTTNRLKSISTQNASKNAFIKEVKKSLPLGFLLPSHMVTKFIGESQQDEKPVLSCDLLIMDGSVAVDESILTGESLP